MTLIRKTTFALAGILGLIAGAQAQPNTELVVAGLNAGYEYVPNELLVQYRLGADKERVEKRLGALGAESLMPALRRVDSKGDLDLVMLPPGRSLAQLVRAFANDPDVEFAEPNWVYHHDASSNDPYYTNGSLWGMYGDASSPTNAYGSQAAEAWAAGKTNCSNVYVGIIDEGFMYNHEDLATNSWTNPSDPVDGVDNDGNGYVDDTHGWDFDGNDNSTFDGATDDHGTHVAGTIAGEGGNGKGVAGVCWSTRLISAKFLGRRGGTTANAILAVDYITDLKTRHGLNIVATNNSWGGGGYSQGLWDAIDRANSADILFIAAAGNSSSNNDSTPHYPSSYSNSNIIAVAAITSSGALSSFSSYGVNSVDIGAPGSGIYSSIPKSVKRTLISSYASYSGTSMATPHVTGAAALYAASKGGSAVDIRNAILSSAVVTPSLNGRVATGGRLDANGALSK